MVVVAAAAGFTVAVVAAAAGGGCGVGHVLLLAAEPVLAGSAADWESAAVEEQSTAL